MTSHEMAMAIHTHGGGELLETVFTALGRMIHGEGKSTFDALVKLAMLFGAFCCVCLAFFRQKFEPLLKYFLLPGLVIVGFLLIPTTTIRIEDSQAKEKKPIEVQNVPLFLGQFAEVTSESFYHLKRLFELTLHTDKKVYSWTRPPHEGEKLLLPRRVTLSNTQLEDNVREFCHECVFRDLGLGRYSKDELRKAEDLGALFGGTSKHPDRKLIQGTSSTRQMYYKSEKASEWMTCQKAWNELLPFLEAECKAISTTLSKDTADRLFNPEIDLQKLVQQRILIDLLKEELSPSAHHQDAPWQRTVLSSLGNVGNFLEVVLFLAFPLVILLALLSFGIRLLLHWVKLLLWVQLWPIIYCIADVFLQSIWNTRMGSLFDAGERTLTLGTAEKLSELYGSMEFFGCIVLVCIPILAWVLVKGGATQIGHLTSTLIAPTPTSGPSEKTTILSSSSARATSQDNSKQSFTEMVMPKAKQGSSQRQDFFQAETAAMRQSLSSLEATVKESAESMKEAIREKQESESKMHQPSYGSWNSEGSA